MIIWPGDSAQSSHWSTDIGGDEIFRIAILSTPRTGNTWLRRLLDGVYSLPQIVADSPADIEWERLSARCILQLHWDRDPALLEKLNEYAFRKIAICRHPLDVLISILHFSSTHAGTSSWVGGRGGGEEAIANVLPRSPAFLEYATGPRADILFSVSCQWATDPECLVVRYESFVQEPVRELTALCNRLLPAPDDAIRYAVQVNTMEKVRKINTNQHCWQGKPGHWKDLLPAQEALRIVAHHRDVFETLGYPSDAGSDCDPGPDRDPNPDYDPNRNSDSDTDFRTGEAIAVARKLAVTRQVSSSHTRRVQATLENTTVMHSPVLTGPQADANWYALEFASLKEECRVARSQVLKVEQCLRDENIAALRSIVDNLKSQVVELGATNDDLRFQLEAMRADRWTPSVVARKVRSLARRLCSVVGLR